MKLTKDDLIIQENQEYAVDNGLLIQGDKEYCEKLINQILKNQEYAEGRLIMLKLIAGILHTDIDNLGDIALQRWKIVERLKKRIEEIKRYNGNWNKEGVIWELQKILGEEK